MRAGHLGSREFGLQGKADLKIYLKGYVWNQAEVRMEQD